MHAAVLHTPGSPPSYAEHPSPAPASGSTLVRVTAAPVVPAVASTVSIPGGNKSAIGTLRLRDRTISATTPEARNSQMISDSVQAVVSALTPNSAHSSRSFPRVSFTSLSALRAMMAMTAAPMP